MIFRVLLTILLFTITISMTGADNREITVFVGHPTVRLVAAGTWDESMKGKIQLEKVPTEKKDEFACIIVKRGDKYFFKSRQNYEVTKHFIGAYVEYRRPDRCDYVRIANPSIRGHELTSALMSSDLTHHYVEHLTIGLTSINYWGRVIIEEGDLR